MIIAFTNTQKKFITAGFLAATLGFAFLFFNQEWFFDGEDWGVVLRSSLIYSTKDVIDTFKHAHVAATDKITIKNIHGLPHGNIHFSNVYYRPILILFYKLQFLLFGTNAYGYFLIFILMHIFITLFLFFFLASITSILIAFYCSLFFGFHPTLYGWIGKVDVQQHSLGLLLFLTALFFFKKTHWPSCLIGSFLFLLSLLTRETGLILPVIFIILSKVEQTNFGNTYFHQKKQVITTMIITCCIYFCMRFYAYPIRLGPPTSLDLSSIKEILHIVTSYLKQLPWTLSFPWNTYLIFKKWDFLYVYNTIRLILVSGTFLLFYFNKKKKLISLLIFFGIIMYWPAFFNKAHELPLRFYYEGLLFFTLAQALLLQKGFLLQTLFCTFSCMYLYNIAHNFQCFSTH